MGADPDRGATSLSEIGTLGNSKNSTQKMLNPLNKPFEQFYQLKKNLALKIFIYKCCKRIFYDKGRSGSDYYFGFSSGTIPNSDPDRSGIRKAEKAVI